MRIIRVALAVVVFVCGFLLYFAANPACGTFQLLSTGPLTDTEYSLIYMKNKQITHAFSLTNIGLGWSGFKSASHFTGAGMLFGILLGFPIGELSRRMFAIDLELEEAKQIKLSASCEVIHAESTMAKAQALCADYPQLKKKIIENQGIIFMLRESKSELEKDNQKLAQLIESAEKELNKATGKIRRLEGQVEPGKAKKPLTCHPNQHKLS